MEIQKKPKNQTTEIEPRSQQPNEWRDSNSNKMPFRKKIPGPERFLAQFYKTFKEGPHSTLLKLHKKTEIEESQTQTLSMKPLTL